MMRQLTNLATRQTCHLPPQCTVAEWTVSNQVLLINFFKNIFSQAKSMTTLLTRNSSKGSFANCSFAKPACYILFYDVLLWQTVHSNADEIRIEPCFSCKHCSMLPATLFSFVTPGLGSILLFNIVDNNEQCGLYVQFLCHVLCYNLCYNLVLSNKIVDFCTKIRMG